MGLFNINSSIFSIISVYIVLFYFNYSYKPIIKDLEDLNNEG